MAVEDLQVGPAGERSAYPDDEFPGRCTRGGYALQAQILLAVQHRRRHLRNHHFYLLISGQTFLFPYPEEDQ